MGEGTRLSMHARWRREFAQMLSTHLQHFADILVIAVLGSVARGYTVATYHPKRTSCSPSPVHVAGMSIPSLAREQRDH